MTVIESLDDILTFVRVVEQGSFQAAGKVQHISKSLVSKRITRLEQQLGVQLLYRSTRRLDLTEAGQHYYEKVKSIPIQLEAARESTLPLSDGMEGSLKLIVPVGFGMSLSQHVLPDFMQDFPNIDIQIKSATEPLDCVHENFDILVSGKQPGELLPDVNLVAKHLLDLPAGIYASADYIETHGLPKTPQDLKSHPCICYFDGDAWPFLDEQGTAYTVQVKPHFYSDNSLLLAHITRAGQGVCYGFDFMFEPEEFAQGRIVKILDDCIPDVLLNCYVFYPKSDYLPAKTREMIEWMLAAYKK